MKEFTPSATVIKDSVNPDGDRLTTFVVKFHRFILPEFNTHRMFSRNASSSRAIPTKKLIDNVLADNVYPLHWGQNQRGMTASEEIKDIEMARIHWETARFNAISSANLLAKTGVHKQVVNRLLEPFSTTTMIVTATEYQNFFKQRCHPDAQPEIKALAIAMMESMQESRPEKLDWGEWHIPFVDELDKGVPLHHLKRIATARCARVSYMTHYGKRDPEEDVRLYNDLFNANPKHLSPFEHIAKAAMGRYANFNGFKSHRWEIEG